MTEADRTVAMLLESVESAGAPATSKRWMDDMQRFSPNRRLKREALAIVALSLALFFLATRLPVASWLEAIVASRGYHLDELVFVFIVFSFILPFFSVRRWLDLRSAFSALAAASDEIRRTALLEGQLSRLTTLLHCCVTPEEACAVVTHYATNLFPGCSGALYVFRSSRNLLEVAATWGADQGGEPFFAPDQCWALRQGQLYESQDPRLTVPCFHVKESSPYLCLPMVAHGEVLALLHMRTRVGEDASNFRSHGPLIGEFAERVSLALSNIKLRNDLRQQSVRDPLTGLFNRRYLEESLTIEAARARRTNEPFSVVILDIDHFKRFNDTHGHDAGDEVLRAIGAFLRSHIRGGDVACRYGGEEFCLLLPNSSSEAAHQRAEQLCADIQTLRLEFQGRVLETLTVSVGVGSYPEHGDMPEIVLHVADAALYEAKKQGRNRAVAA